MNIRILCYQSTGKSLSLSDLFMHKALMVGGGGGGGGGRILDCKVFITPLFIHLIFIFFFIFW